MSCPVSACGGVRYMIVGLSAAIIQGVNTAPRDIDLWFATISDPQIAPAAAAAGVIWGSDFDSTS